MGTGRPSRASALCLRLEMPRAALRRRSVLPFSRPVRRQRPGAGCPVTTRHGRREAGAGGARRPGASWRQWVGCRAGPGAWLGRLAPRLGLLGSRGRAGTQPTSSHARRSPEHRTAAPGCPCDRVLRAQGTQGCHAPTLLAPPCLSLGAVPSSSRQGSGHPSPRPRVTAPSAVHHARHARHSSTPPHSIRLLSAYTERVSAPGPRAERVARKGSTTRHVLPPPRPRGQPPARSEAPVRPRVRPRRPSARGGLCSRCLLARKASKSTWGSGREGRDYT